MSVMTSREFNQHTHAAKLAAFESPLIITSRGVPSHVLVSYDEWTHHDRAPKTLLDEFAAMPQTPDVDLELPPRRVEASRDLNLGIGLD